MRFVRLSDQFSINSDKVIAFGRLDKSRVKVYVPLGMAVNTLELNMSFESFEALMRYAETLDKPIQQQEIRTSVPQGFQSWTPVP